MKIILHSVLIGAVGLILSGSPIMADQTDSRLADLFADLKAADEDAAISLESRIWEIWSISQSSTAALLMERAELALSAGEIELADELAEHVTGIAPSFAEGWHFKARIQLAGEQFEDAASSLEQAIELEPRHFGAYAALGELFLSLGQERAAYDAFNKALEFHPNFEGAVQSVAQLKLKVEGRGI